MIPAKSQFMRNPCVNEAQSGRNQGGLSFRNHLVFPCSSFSVQSQSNTTGFQYPVPTGTDTLE